MDHIIEEILTQHPDASFRTWQDKGAVRVCIHQQNEESRVALMGLCQRLREEGYRASLKFLQGGPEILVRERQDP